jgi:hypothetical protein
MKKQHSTSPNKLGLDKTKLAPLSPDKLEKVQGGGGGDTPSRAGIWY